MAAGTEHPLPLHDAPTWRLPPQAHDGAVSPLDPTVPNPELPAAHRARPQTPVALAAATAGRFAWQRTLGAGGMGEVWLAQDKVLGREVAIKTLRVNTASGWSQLQWEARLLARLRHPAIVQVHELLEAGGQPLLVMEFAPGQDLAAVLRQRRLPRPDFLRLMIEVCDAVAYAHAHGVTHRDIKPGNLMLTPEGRVRVMDFGIAELGRAGSGTLSASATGTPGYMAPELFDAQPAPGVASDVFALGATLYQGLTGRRPFGEGGALDIIGRTLRGELAAPATLRATLGHDLAAVVLKALAHEPAHRHASAAALADDLRRVLGGLPVSARHYPPWARLGRALAWRWGAALLGAAASFGILGLINLSASSVHAHAEQTALRTFEDAAREVALMTGLAMQAPPEAAPAEAVIGHLKRQNTHVRDAYLLSRDSEGWRLRFAQHGAEAQREQPRGHDTWDMQAGIVTRTEARQRLEAALAGGLALEYEHDSEGRGHQEWNRRLLVYAPAAWRQGRPTAVVVLEYASDAVLDIFLDIERALELSLLAGVALAATLLLLHWAWLTRAWRTTPPD